MSTNFTNDPRSGPANLRWMPLFADVNLGTLFFPLTFGFLTSTLFDFGCPKNQNGSNLWCRLLTAFDFEVSLYELKVLLLVLLVAAGGGCILLHFVTSHLWGSAHTSAISYCLFFRSSFVCEESGYMLLCWRVNVFLPARRVFFSLFLL